MFVVSNINGALNLYKDEQHSSGDKWSLLIKSIPSNNFMVEIGFTQILSPWNWQLTGLTLFELATNKFIVFSYRNDQVLEVCRFNNPNSWIQTLYGGVHRSVSPILLLQISKIGNDIYFYISIDSINWTQVYYMVNDFIPPTHIGFGINPYISGKEMYALFVHWKVYQL